MDKLQHEMYWNDSGKKDEDKPEQDKLQHEMYWNLEILKQVYEIDEINYNMRCIETVFPH